MKNTRPFKLNTLSFMIMMAMASPAQPNPTLGQVVAGQAQMQQSGNVLTVNTGSQKTIIDWNTFSIAPGETTRFNQPNSSASVLNRVLSTEPSSILGSLQSNGKVFLINPYGILVGAGASINVAGFVASTLNISNQDFLQDRFNFHANGFTAAVRNDGGIETPAGGSVYLLGSAVENKGMITAPNGEVLLASGETISLIDTGTPGVRIDVTAAPGKTVNLGKIIASAGTIGLAGALVQNDSELNASSVVQEGGRIFLKAQANSAGQSAAIIHSGQANADSELMNGGSIEFQADNVLLTGSTSASGADGGQINIQGAQQVLQTRGSTLQADGENSGGHIVVHSSDGVVFSSGNIQANGNTGGQIDALGKHVVLNGAQLNATGANLGGTVRVGGDYQGTNPAVQIADTVTVNKTTVIDTSATQQGDGGKAVVWAEERTEFAGAIKAEGGVQGGNGGFVEVSAKETLAFQGTASTSAPNGENGTLLLDPKNLIVGEAASGAPVFLRLLDGPEGAGDSFTIEELANGNIVVGAINNDFIANNAGAAYLFDSSSYELISAFYGANIGDNIGSIRLLENGNYLISGLSTDRPDSGTGNLIANVGSITWASQTTGRNGIVSETNSLLGSKANEQVSIPANLKTLSNGNFVIAQPTWDNGTTLNVGAVTWGNGQDGSTVGIVGVNNSLVGTKAEDRVGEGIQALPNGNYVVISPFWDDGATTNTGAVTWVNGNTGLTGTVNIENSLLGRFAQDRIGLISTNFPGTNTRAQVQVLSNGNYLLSSPFWGKTGESTLEGAVTLLQANQPLSGRLTPEMSLTGNNIQDRIGLRGIAVLNNGNYVVGSETWNALRGATTWVNGTSGGAGQVVSAENSIVGGTAGDRIGRLVVPLTNGNYVSVSVTWDSPQVVNAGALTWGSGTGPTAIEVSAENSIIGSATDDFGTFLPRIDPLSNGNFVFSSPVWNGAGTDRGFAMWGDGANGTTVGEVNASNALIGSNDFDNIGNSRTEILSNGNYVVSSPDWGGVLQNNSDGLGAVTWGNGLGGTVGEINASNSLIGSVQGDRIGNNYVVALSDGDYLVLNPDWSAQRGAATWGNGNTGVSGVVSSANSLVGQTAGDRVGADGTGLANGNYVVFTYNYNNAGAVDAGAVTWGDGTVGTRGVISSSNSLVGTRTDDQVGWQFLETFADGASYAIKSPNFSFEENGVLLTQAGALTVSDGTGPITGTVTRENSLIGSNNLDRISSGAFEPLQGNRFAISSPLANNLNGRIDIYTGNEDNNISVENANFGFDPGADYTLTAATLGNLLSSGNNVALQANNDVLFNTALQANNLQGNGGSLTVQAGRSIEFNANVFTDNGDLNLIANDNQANPQFRDPGAGNINIAEGVNVNTGTGSMNASINTTGGEAGSFNNSGTLSVGGQSNINAVLNNFGTINIASNGAVLLMQGGSQAGFVNLSAGSALSVSNGILGLEEGSDISGEGQLRVEGGTVNVNATETHIDNLAINGGVFNGSASSMNVAIIDNTLSWTQGTLTGLGATTVAGNATITNSSGNASGVLLDSQTLNILGNLQVDGQNGLVVNGASLNIAANAIVNNNSSLSVNAASQLNLAGTLVNNGLVNVANDLILNIGASYQGTGTLNGNLVNTAGTVAPGNSPGAMVINGDYSQGANGTLLIEVGGTNAGVDYDQLQVNGAVNLAGTLATNLINSYLPAPGTAVPDIIQTPNPVTGQFTQVTAPSGFENSSAAITTNGIELTLGQAPVVTVPPPVVVEPPPAVVEPTPVVVEPAPVVVEPAPVVVAPPPVVLEPAPEIANTLPINVEQAQSPTVNSTEQGIESVNVAAFNSASLNTEFFNDPEIAESISSLEPSEPSAFAQSDEEEQNDQVQIAGESVNLSNSEALLPQPNKRLGGRPIGMCTPAGNI